MSELIPSNIASQFTQLPPHDGDAERCVLASAMLDGKAHIEARSILDTDDFFVADNQSIWETICELADAGSAIDAIIVKSALEKKKLYQEVGGKEYLKQILEAVPTHTHVAHYARIVKEHSVHRQIIALANDALRRAYGPKGGITAADLACELASGFSGLSANTGQKDSVSLEDAIHEVIDRRDAGKPQRIPTGLHTLDEIIGGVGLGRTLIIGGKPGMGKSQLGKQIINNIATTGIPCGIVSVEEGRTKIAENFLSRASGIENHRIAFNSLNDTEWKRVYNTCGKPAALPIWIDDAAFDLNEITASIQRLVAKHRVQAVMVDHIHLIGVDAEKDSTRERQISKISAGLKVLFRKLNIAGMVMAQLNRGGEREERPTLSNLRDSGSLEQDGDTIILLHRSDYYNYRKPHYTPDHQLEAIVAKNKDGRMGVAPLYFDGGIQIVRDWERTEVEAA